MPAPAFKRSNVPAGTRLFRMVVDGLATADLFTDEEIGLSEPMLGIDPSECDGKHPRTWDNCCHGCGTRIIPHPARKS